VLYFLRFCSVVGIDAEQFGAREEDGGLTLSEEEEVLALFATYVVHHPRRNHKLLNTADYAACCLSAVRCWVKDYHRRSPGADPRHSLLLTRALAGLQKLSPSGIREPRAPILQIHMRAIRSRLDLEGNALHRVLWALWTTCWQGVNRYSPPACPSSSPYIPQIFPGLGI